MTARWQATHAYALGTIILPTVDNGRCFYASAGGTSGSTEPTWPGRYPGVVDGSVTWTPYTIVQPATIRTIQGWDDSTGRYSDNVIGNYLLDSISELEKSTRRFFVNKPGFTWQVTSYGRPILALPGLRTASSVTWQGAVQTAGIPGQGSGYMLLPDAQQTGVCTSISFRPRRIPDGDSPWWLSLGQPGVDWFSTGADNPYDPRNYGGGYVFTSTELDTLITGDWGYEPGLEPNAFVHALEILGSFAQQRPVSLLADSVITPQGGVLSYSQMPPEIRQFISDWSAGTMAVSLG